MNNLSLDLLRVLIAVAESANFREAADKLKLSQPAVSIKLRTLESAHPLPIFQLEGKRKVLTRYGRSLYEMAKEGTSALERRIEDLERIYGDEKLLNVRVAGRGELLEYVVPRLEFKGRVECVVASGQEAAEKLLRHEIDLALTYVRPDSTELQAKKIFSSKVYFCVHESLVKGRRLTLELIFDAEFLQAHPAIAYGAEGLVLRDLVKHAKCTLEGLDIRFACEDWRLLAGLVDQGCGFSVLPHYVLPESPEVLRLEIPSRMAPTLDFYAVFESGLRKVKAYQNLLTFARL